MRPGTSFFEITSENKALGAPGRALTARPRGPIPACDRREPGEPGRCPSDPPSHVHSQPGGVARLPRLLLIKPDCTGKEILHRLRAPVHTGRRFLCLVARRTQFISSLIESWGSKTEQTLPRAGLSPKRIDQIVNLARTQFKRRLIACWDENSILQKPTWNHAFCDGNLTNQALSCAP